jgi:hypothetical protein
MGVVGVAAGGFLSNPPRTCPVAIPTCCERLRLQRLKWWVGSDMEIMCSRVAHTGKLSPVALALSERGILYLAQVSLFG